jgi:hypothetical protein
MEALKESLFLNFDEEKETVGRKDKNLPKFKFKRFIVLENEEYEMTEEEK